MEFLSGISKSEQPSKSDQSSLTRREFNLLEIIKRISEMFIYPGNYIFKIVVLPKMRAVLILSLFVNAFTVSGKSKQKTT